MGDFEIENWFFFVVVGFIIIGTDHFRYTYYANMETKVNDSVKFEFKIDFQNINIFSSKWKRYIFWTFRIVHIWIVWIFVWLHSLLSSFFIFLFAYIYRLDGSVWLLTFYFLLNIIVFICVFFFWKIIFSFEFIRILPRFLLMDFISAMYKFICFFFSSKLRFIIL